MSSSSWNLGGPQLEITKFPKWPVWVSPLGPDFCPGALGPAALVSRKDEELNYWVSLLSWLLADSICTYWARFWEPLSILVKSYFQFEQFGGTIHPNYGFPGLQLKSCLHAESWVLPFSALKMWLLWSLLYLYIILSPWYPVSSTSPLTNQRLMQRMSSTCLFLTGISPLPWAGSFWRAS